MSQFKKCAGTFRYGKKEITFNFWIDRTEANLEPDTVLFLGAGQTGSICRWVAHAAGPRVVVVEGLPHWEAHPSAEDIVEFSKAYIHTALQAVLTAFTLPSVNIIGESQAAPATVVLASSAPDKVRNIVLIRPLGFSVHAFGSSDQERLHAFRRRIMRTALQFSQSFFHDPRNVGVISIMTRTMLREPTMRALVKKYAAGIAYDILEDCRQVAKQQQLNGHSFTILLGEKDKMFPPSEVVAVLKSSGIVGVTIKILPKTVHSSLAVRSSKVILKQAIDIAQLRP